MTHLITLLSCLAILMAATLPFLRAAARKRYRADVEGVMRSVAAHCEALEAAHRRLDAMAQQAARGDGRRNTP